MSEYSPEPGHDSLERYDLDENYQDEAQVLDESLSRHRDVPLYKPGSEGKPEEPVVLTPDQRLGTPFEKVTVIFSPPGKDPYAPFVNIQLSTNYAERDIVVETKLHYFEDRYLAVRMVYALDSKGHYEMKPGSIMESEVTSRDLSQLNTIINNSIAVS